MDKRKIIFPLFIILVLIQLYVPAKIIWDKESIIISGTEYKFKTAPIDPTDPFRGKYIVLRFKENFLINTTNTKLKRNDEIYVNLKTDSTGFVKPKSFSKEKPKHNKNDFLKVTVRYSNNKKIYINYPFKRYYMEESKAYEAELIHRKEQRRRNSNTYAIVSVKDGVGVLKDVLIDGIPIKEMVKNQRKNSN